MTFVYLKFLIGVLTELCLYIFNFRLKSEICQLQLRLSENLEIVEKNQHTIKKLESNLSVSNAEILSLKIEAEKHSATILDLKSDIMSEQLKNKHLLDISTERLAEREDLRQKLRNTDDVIGRLEKNVADIICIKKDLINQEKQFQKEDNIQNLQSALNGKHNQRNTLDGELKMKANKGTKTKTLRVIFF